MPLMHKIRSALIASSIESYLLTRGNCPCPYLRDAADRRCGKSSAYCKPQGEQPLYFDEDTDEEMIKPYAIGSPVLRPSRISHQRRCLRLTLCATLTSPRQVNSPACTASTSRPRTSRA